MKNKKSNKWHFPLPNISVFHLFFFLFRSGVGEPQRHLHLQWSGDELQRRCHRCVCQPVVLGQWWGGEGGCLREPYPGRGQWGNNSLPGQPEVTRGFHLPHRSVERDSASSRGDGGAGTGEVKGFVCLWSAQIQWSLIITVTYSQSIMRKNLPINQL